MYVSRCLIPHAVQKEGLASIVAAARIRNERDGITGCLALQNDHFVQVLEGEHAIVDALIGRIGRDRRHADLLVRLRREVRSRSFSDWRMAWVTTADAGQTGWSDGGMAFDPMTTPAAVLLAHMIARADTIGPMSGG